MEPIYFEIFLKAQDLTAANCSRDELEVPLQNALEQARLGTVTGGGSGSKGSIIEVEVTAPDRVSEALQLMRRTLADNRAPQSTVIKQVDPAGETWGLQ
jgi:hypothetical protein